MRGVAVCLLIFLTAGYANWSDRQQRVDEAVSIRDGLQKAQDTDRWWWDARARGCHCYAASVPIGPVSSTQLAPRELIRFQDRYSRH